jgi:hypothetical protein
MKITIAVLVLVLSFFVSSGSNVAAQEVTSSTTFLGHQLGETVDEWKVPAGVDCSTRHNKKLCEQARSGVLAEIETQSAPTRKRYVAGILLVEGVVNYSWVFQGGKLVELRFHDSGHLTSLYDKYGEPTKVQTEAWQNAYGASWEDHTFTWVKSDGTIISATPLTHDADNSVYVIQFTTAERIAWVEQKMQELKTKDAPKY